jgi:hypothetical protein
LRRSTLALSSSLAAIGLTASIALAQQFSQAPAPNASPPASDESIDPSMASRPTRYLLRNGQDYLAYREYARALSFFRAVEVRQAQAVAIKQSELNDAELASLKKGISQAQQGLRETVNGNRVVVQGKGRPNVQPGALALVKPGQSPASEAGPTPNDSLQLASAELPAPPPLPQTRGLPRLPAPLPHAMTLPPPGESDMPVFGVGRATPPLTRAPDAPTVPAEAPVEVPAQPEAAPAGLPNPSATATQVPASDPVKLTPEVPAAPTLPPLPPASSPTADPSTTPAQATSPLELPPSNPSPTPIPAIPPAEAPPPLVLESSSPSPSPLPTTSPAPVDLPPISPAPVELPPTSPAPVELPPTSPAPVELPPIGPAPVDLPPTTPPIPSEPAPVIPRPEEPGAAASVPARVADASQGPDSSVPSLPASASIPEPPPAPEAPTAREPYSLPPLPGSSNADRPDEPVSSILNEKLRREVEQIAQRPPGDRGPVGIDPNSGMAPSPGSTRLELQRAPSPTEARPMRRIPVPEEYQRLGKREWNPERKYWAAAGTCHMILYFQDPVLERYGQSVEQSLGPIGRYFSYPLDDPKQSNQRNQILQPFYSMGKFCFQVGTLPYKLVVDPPWESEYDLGYYRPGDRIPPDTIMITPTGIGPPLHGRNY